jgi:hypothetical protein
MVYDYAHIAYKQTFVCLTLNDGRDTSSQIPALYSNFKTLVVKVTFDRIMILILGFNARPSLSCGVY